MNKLSSDVHTYISNFLEYQDILLSLKPVNKYFNLLSTREPEQPHNYVIDHYPNSNTTRLINSIDGKIKWIYRKTVEDGKTKHLTIRDDRFSITSFISGSIWDLKEKEVLDNWSDLNFMVFCRMNERLELAEEYIKKHCST